MSKYVVTSVISQVLLLSASGCFLVGAGITLSDIGARALFNSHINGAIELTTLTIALGALLSMPVAYARRGHITAKLLSEFSPLWVNKSLGILGASLSVLFATLLLVACGLQLIEQFGSPEITPDTGIPIYILLSIVVFTLLLALMASLYAAAQSFDGTKSVKSGDVQNG